MADLSVLSADYFSIPEEDIKQIESVLTLVGGKVVYAAKDFASPMHYIETFLVESWVEHMRQHERVTVADQEAEKVSLAFHVGDQPPVVTHFISTND